MDTTSEAERLVLTINGGSSSIKFAVYALADPPAPRLHGQVERIGQPGAQLVAKREGSSSSDSRPIDAADYQSAAKSLIDYLQESVGHSAIAGIGHRIVHGGLHLAESQPVTPGMIAELRKTEPLDLAHLPREISLIESFQEAFPELLQMACLDTAFHHNLPTVARMLPIPRRYYEQGIRRFGFHGLSYTYLMKELAKVAGEVAAQGRVILAHLGSGASMAAVYQGRPVDTTMAFTPTAGLMMGTRPGDLDPGFLVYLMRVEKLSPDQMDDFISSRCGLIGVSESSSDVRDLLEHRQSDPRAAEAIDLFCYTARKQIGALAASLGGLDTLVFSGGIGEHAPEIRSAICEGLEFLGLKLDSNENQRGQDIISSSQSRVTVRVIPTDEEIIIAEIVAAALESAK